jgi:hypothetical protein
MTQPKFLIRSEEDYYEFNLDYCGRRIKQFKKSYFKTNSKHPARIYAKAFFPNNCPEQFWMYYLVFEVNSKPLEIISIKREAFDIITRGIEPDCYESIEFYTIEEHTKVISEFIS